MTNAKVRKVSVSVPEHLLVHCLLVHCLFVCLFTCLLVPLCVEPAVNSPFNTFSAGFVSALRNIFFISKSGALRQYSLFFVELKLESLASPLDLASRESILNGICRIDCPDFLMVAQAVDEEQSWVNGLVKLSLILKRRPWSTRKVAFEVYHDIRQGFRFLVRPVKRKRIECVLPQASE